MKSPEDVGALVRELLPQAAAAHVVQRGELTWPTRGSSTWCARPAARAEPTARCTTSIRRSCSPSASRRSSPRNGFDPVDVDDVIAGNGILTGDHDAVGRLATLLAGWPETVPGLTLNRFCGSAQQAITVAAMGVASGMQDLVVAGGVESMSRWDLSAGSVTIDGGNPDFRAAFPTVPQGISADLIATLEGFSRDDVDAFAVESQRRAAVAIAEGRFDRGVDRGDRCRRRGPARPRRASPAGHDARRHWRSCAPRSRRWARTYDDDWRCARYPQVDHIDHVHHAGQLVRCRRRRRRRVRGVGRLGQRQRRHAAGARPRHRRDRLRAGDHAHRARARPPSAASPRPA